MENDLFLIPAATPPSTSTSNMSSSTSNGSSDRTISQFSRSSTESSDRTIPQENSEEEVKHDPLNIPARKCVLPHTSRYKNAADRCLSVSLPGDMSGDDYKDALRTYYLERMSVWENLQKSIDTKTGNTGWNPSHLDRLLDSRKHTRNLMLLKIDDDANGDEESDVDIAMAKHLADCLVPCVDFREANHWLDEQEELCKAASSEQGVRI